METPENKDWLDDYELSYQEFYSEIPGSTDYLNDIDPEIQDEHDTNETTSGLSAEQVSQIARDNLGTQQASSSDSNRPQLFNQDDDSQEPPV